jgi:archaeosine synthase
MLELLARSGTARRCLWSLEGAKAETPGAFVLEGGAEGLALELAGDSSSLLMDGRTVLEMKGNGLIPPLRSRNGMKDSCLPPAAEGQEVAILEGAFELRRDARAFVKAIVDLRTKVGRSRLIYAPGIAEPSNLAVLSYLGVDLFDTSLVDHRAALGQLSLVEGAMDASKASWVPDGSDLKALNRDTMSKELALVRSMISSGRMREFAELRCHSTPWNVAALRIFDDEHYAHQEIDFSVIGPRFYCNAKQSLVRPDVRRFREMVKSRFRRPEHRRILLLIPCSAKKPYYTSKSHQLFRQVLWRLPNSQVVQEMIVTLSASAPCPGSWSCSIPRRSTKSGHRHWDREEEAMVQDMVLSMALRATIRWCCIWATRDDHPGGSDGTTPPYGSPTSSESWES